MDFNIITICFACTVLLSSSLVVSDLLQEPPEGYYAFVESPNAEPPRVKRQHYTFSDKDCPGIHDGDHSYNSLFNLCGDLNKGTIPRNPMGQKVLGVSYPFELLKNKTLEFFSRTLPILKADETLPRVAKYRQDSDDWNNNQLSYNSISPDHRQRTKRETEKTKSEESEESPRRAQDKTIINTLQREARKFCDNGGGVHRITSQDAKQTSLTVDHQLTFSSC